ncbi:hypothetical protein GCM10009798_32570 [Nocardioides panacihumi]|uniref:Right handed beta helix domain-containing protein n=1 Tax=Nocardioides panacihumi TaxID=400774 RepID=A0ABN2RHW5_9ACTN
MNQRTVAALVRGSKVGALLASVLLVATLAPGVSTAPAVARTGATGPVSVRLSVATQVSDQAKPRAVVTLTRGVSKLPPGIVVVRTSTKVLGTARTTKSARKVKVAVRLRPIRAGSHRVYAVFKAGGHSLGSSARKTVTAHRGCVWRPRTCGFPDGSNTGPARGTVFRSVPGDVRSGPGWTYDPRGWITVSGNGAVLKNLRLSGISIEVHASNVTIRNNRITVVGDNWAVGLREGSNIHVSHNLITAPSATGSTRGMVAVKDISGTVTSPVVDHNDISRMSTGIQMDSGTVADNYIHDMGYKAGDHLNGFTSNGGTRPLVVHHNTILNSYDQTDAISLFQDFNIQANRRVTDNLVGGGGYTIYAGGGYKGLSNHITITGNRFARSYFPNSGHWGPVTAWDANGARNIWSRNVWDMNGRPVTHS